MLTTDEACERLPKEGEESVHVREGVRLPRVALQHSPAGGHVQGGCIHGVHSAVHTAAGNHGPGKNPDTHCDGAKASQVSGWMEETHTGLVEQQSATRVS